MIERYLGDSHEKLFEHDMEVALIPEGAVEKGEPFDLPCDLLLKPTTLLDEWSIANKVNYVLGFGDEDNLPMIGFDSAEDAALFEESFGAFKEV